MFSIEAEILVVGALVGGAGGATRALVGGCLGAWERLVESLFLMFWLESDCFNPFWLEGGGGGGGAFGLDGGGGGGQAGFKILFGEILGGPFGFVGVDDVEEVASQSVAVVLKVSVLVTLLFLLRVGVRLRFMLAVLSLTLESREVSERAVSEVDEQEFPDSLFCTIGSEKSSMIPFSSVAMTMLETMLVRSSTLLGTAGISSSSEFGSSASALGAFPLTVNLSPPFSWLLPALLSPNRASSSSFSSSSSSCFGLLSCGTTGMRTFLACRGSREY